MKKAFRDFFATEVASGLILLLCTLLALALANSQAAPTYFHALHLRALGLSLHHWINDGLMALFFFVVGMEIKRELLAGELSSRRKAALPIAAALGGMLGPALLYLAFNLGAAGVPRGWGIPMATDIAFALAALSVFGRRLPGTLRIFLLALAIVDDLGAVLVIALFYSDQIHGPFLALAALPLLCIGLARQARIRPLAVYVLLGVGVWFWFLRSGVHATIAGVILGFFVPIRDRDGEEPLAHWVSKLHPWVSFGIMPVFALANAGVDLRGLNLGGLFSAPVFLGVVVGLVVGKPLGILLAAWAAVRAGWAELPRGVHWRHVVGLGCLAGIGFTMALFIAGLALPPESLGFAKIGILLGSCVAAVGGWCVLWAGAKKVTLKD